MRYAHTKVEKRRPNVSGQQSEVNARKEDAPPRLIRLLLIFRWYKLGSNLRAVLADIKEYTLVALYKR